MTATDARSAAAPDQASAPVLTPTLGRRLRASRGRIVIGVVAIVVAVLGVLIAGQSAQQRPPLDPASATPTGAKALVEVLRAHGVDVRPATTLEQAADAAADAAPDQVTIAVYDPNRFLPVAKLAGDDRLAERTVLIAPPKGMADALRAAGRDVAVIRTASVLENQHIAEGGNAGEAIRLLGGTRVLVWYTPGLSDLGVTAPKTIADLTPPWVTPLIVLAALIVAAAAAWRGRRFGALVIEDLPVVVRASEALEGRARLYQRSDARLTALDAVRMGAVGRLATRLGLGPGAAVTDVCAAVAARLRLDPAGVRGTLLDAEPRTDAELMELTRRVAALEASVTGSNQPGEWHR
ncbi:DUF4350 domain-containing protein [Gryllotalpicola protaetiae]|uniref:DUF4350 domain-containing protein n=1 Tax=Gryllotalpicola protaetiae TaxID=2419771 RepID=A0A387C1A1_9MICO|nr:DUF4350 domain-containing protein [Gryllotalpicola protaetiae]AYG04301.1 DUF4350 domain-containing protein [Gryllotalpicola protaetiae]